ncbi:MAG: sugar transferase [Gemmatimonadota bacterium]
MGVKRLLDAVVAALLLAVLAPLILLLATAVLLTSGRPVFFGHRRLGRGGVPFRCWKLRTMQEDAELVLAASPALHESYIANGYKLPVAEDPRVTQLGAFLRRTYLDELPQLFNVIQGSMSLVGPRPIVEAEAGNYGEHSAELLHVRPGLIGAWTSRGHARPPYPERAQIELEYVRGRSLRRDAHLLLLALPVILRGQPEDS